MITQDEYIAIHETILSLAQQMLEVAEQRDEQQLAELEAVFSQQIDILKQYSPHMALNQQQRTKVMTLVAEILKCNHLLFNITRPWQHELALKISSLDTQQKVQQAYNQHSD